MGIGCNAVGVTGARIIDSKRERLISILTNSFMPCNGRYPTMIAIISMFFIGGSRGILSSIICLLNKDKNGFVRIFTAVIICILLSYIYNLVLNYGIYAARMKVSLGMMISLILVDSLFVINESKKSNKLINGIFYVFVIAYAVLNVINYVDLIDQSLFVNEKEKIRQE